MIVADTDVLIDYLRGQEPARRRLAELLERGELAVTAVTRFELLVGARGEREQRAIRQLLDGLDVAPLDQPAADRAAAIHLELESRGEPIGFADSLIAGIVLVRDTELLTRNRRHFERVPELRLAAWPGADEVHDSGAED